MAVLEMEAGRGYFSEVISRAIGPGGHVLAVNPDALSAFFGNDLAKRIERKGLDNVKIDTLGFDTFDTAPGSFDLATWIQGPHKIWFEPVTGVSLGDPDAVFKRIFDSLKPGASFIVIDHHAPTASGSSAGGTLHRIEASLVIGYVERAGFHLEETATFLERLRDVLSKPSYDRSVRGKTSQFVLLFRKPK